MDNLTDLIIYLFIGIIGLLVSVYRNKQKQQAQKGPLPRDIVGKPMADVHPDLGPLAEIFGIPGITVSETAHESEVIETNVETDGYLVEAGGEKAEAEGFLIEKEGIEIEGQPGNIEQGGLEAEKTEGEGIPVFKATREVILSDAIMTDTIADSEGIYEPIHMTEIKSVDENEKTRSTERIDWKKAVIYSEILQRKGF